MHVLKKICDNKTSLTLIYLHGLKMSSAHDAGNQTVRMGNPPFKLVIAMVANIAAFGLLGSSQNVGTEVKSS